jgi:peptidyl-prolyl cis-trans isomerase B (cyclophilin B)
MKRLMYSLLVTAFAATLCAAPATTTKNTTTAAKKKTASKTEKSMKDYTDKVAELQTTEGTIAIRFFPDVAPNHVKNFLDLAKQGFYNGTKFHRVIPGFMIQGGDPNTKTSDVNKWGRGGSPKNVKAEFNDVHHARGIVSMARSSDPDSASSQFFICVADAGSLDHQYSAFGQVVSGMDVADKIVAGKRTVNDRPISPVELKSVTIRDAKEGEKGPAPK